MTSMPTIAVKLARRATDAEWDRIVDSSPQATFFHTRTWAQTWEKHSGGALKPAAWLVRFADGVDAVLPSSEKTLGDLPYVSGLRQLRTTVSSTGNSYGGWIGSRALTAGHHRALWQHLDGANAVIHQNPLDEGLREFDSEFGIPWSEAETTQIVDLRRTEAELRKGFNRGHLSAINKARKAGLAIESAEDEADWREYFEIYTDSFERWGDPEGMLDYPFFDVLRRQDPKRVKLWVVRHEGRILAGIIALYHQRSVQYWHGAFRMDQQKLRAAPFLHSEVMSAALADGYWWYDFNPSGGIEGVMTFKERFGAEKVPASTVVRTGPLKSALGTAAKLVGRG